MQRITLQLDAELYSILYTGILASECELSRKELRAIGRVSDILEEFGIQQTDGTYKLDESKATSGSVSIQLDKYDLDVTNKVISAVKWRPSSARRIVKLFDVLDTERDKEE
jgi:hypothetical protein